MERFQTTIRYKTLAILLNKVASVCRTPSHCEKRLAMNASLQWGNVHSMVDCNVIDCECLSDKNTQKRPRLAHIFHCSQGLLWEHVIFSSCTPTNCASFTKLLTFKKHSREIPYAALNHGLENFKMWCPLYCSFILSKVINIQSRVQDLMLHAVFAYYVS